VPENSCPGTQIASAGVMTATASAPEENVVPGEIISPRRTDRYTHGLGSLRTGGWSPADRDGFLEGVRVVTESAPAERDRSLPPAPWQDFGESPFELPAVLPTQAPVEIRDFAQEVVEFPEETTSLSGLAGEPVTAIGAVPARATELALPSARSGVVRRIARGIAWLVRTLWGIVSLTVLLAFIAAIPVVNFLALGYLLEVEGRVARSGRLRDAFPLLPLAPRLGSLVLGTWLWIVPLRLLSHLLGDIHLIQPGSRADALGHVLLLTAAGLVTIHLLLAVARGGALSCFFRPIKNVLWLRQRWLQGDYWTTAEREVGAFLAGLRLRHHFLLGLKGFVGALAWLALPTLMFAAANRTEGGPVLITLLGALLLIPVLSWVPFLQAHLAAENRLGAMFELRRVRSLYRHAPFSWLITILVTLLFALPMYLFKAAIPPRDALWLVTLVFVVSIYPVKVLTGWAYHRALRQERPSHWLWRWVCWFPTLPLLAFYIFLLHFTQFIGKYGKLTLFEHHSFLVPSPYSFLN